MAYYSPIRLAVIVCLLAAAFVVAVPLMPGAGAQNSNTDATQQMIKPYNYPAARKSDQVDDYHGVKVADPYRWLEDLDSEETRAWVEAQNKLSFGYLASIPERDALKDRITKLWNYEK
jgi:prolyl oligopeptidase